MSQSQSMADIPANQQEADILSALAEETARTRRLIEEDFDKFLDEALDQALENREAKVTVGRWAPTAKGKPKFVPVVSFEGDAREICADVVGAASAAKAAGRLRPHGFMVPSKDGTGAYKIEL